MSTKKKIITISLIVFACVAISMLMLGWFPIARVSGHMVWYRDMRALERATQSVKGYVSKTPMLKLEWNDADDTRKAVVGELIVREVMKLSLDEFGRADIDRAVAESVSKIRSSGNIEKTGNGLEYFYKMDYEQFERLVIVPQLLESALLEQVEKSGKDYTEWLIGEGKKVDVKIYFLPYEWRDGVLQNK